MKKFNFNEFDKYTKKDKIYLYFYITMAVILLLVIALNAVTLAFNTNATISIIFLIIFSLLFLFIDYLLISYLIVPKTLLKVDYDSEKIIIYKTYKKTIELPLKDINEIKTTEQKVFLNVLNLGSLYFLTNSKTYRVKYLISPKYLSITLNVLISVIKEGGKSNA